VTTATATAPEKLVEPAPAEAQDLDRLHERIDAIFASGGRTARLVGPDGESLELPASAFEALKLVAQCLAQGQAITLVPQGKELTTQQAADLLHLSRTYLVRLLDRGEIPFHYAGTHRRLRIEDVVEYRHRRASHRQRKLQELGEMAEEFGIVE
jgi:excisionase family DNA binding protein